MDCAAQWIYGDPEHDWLNPPDVPGMPGLASSAHRLNVASTSNLCKACPAIGTVHT